MEIHFSHASVWPLLSMVNPIAWFAVLILICVGTVPDMPILNSEVLLMSAPLSAFGGKKGKYLGCTGTRTLTLDLTPFLHNVVPECLVGLLWVILRDFCLPRSPLCCLPLCPPRCACLRCLMPSMLGLSVALPLLGLARSWHVFSPLIQFWYSCQCLVERFVSALFWYLVLQRDAWLLAWCSHGGLCSCVAVPLLEVRGASGSSSSGSRQG